MNDFKSQKIKNALKKLLKIKKITYEDLADQIECSVPTVKRFLGPEELTLSRLLQLCEIVEVDLAELEALTNEAGIKHEQFTKEQEVFLAKNKAHFAYLLKIYSGDSPKQIAEQYGLTPRSTDKYLIPLEKIGLIRVSGRQKVKPTYGSMPTLRNGPLAKVFAENMVKSGNQFFLERVLEGVHSAESGAPHLDSAKFGLNVCKVTKASFIAWTQELTKLMHDLEKIGSFEEKTKEPSELMSAVIMDAFTILPHDHPSLKRLDASIGVIVNL